jgi:hypothetical protein
MKRLILTCMAVLLPFAVLAIASAADFAAGSAKTETGLTVGGEHASFQVHCLKNATCVNTTLNCFASGQMVYKADVSPYASSGPLEFRAQLSQLRIQPNAPAPGSSVALFYGTITDVATGPQSLAGQNFYVDILDSGLPGGGGDQFFLEPPHAFPGSCSGPLVTGKVIDQGNIVIKSTP